MWKMGSFERGSAIRRCLAHTNTDSCNQQKKEEEDSRVQLVSTDKAFCITSDWVGILRRCTVMIGICKCAVWGSLPFCICMYVCVYVCVSKKGKWGCDSVCLSQDLRLENVQMKMYSPFRGKGLTNTVITVHLLQCWILDLELLYSIHSLCFTSLNWTRFVLLGVVGNILLVRDT